WKVARQLGVDYYSLKRRVTGTRRSTSAESVKFVEIPPKVLSTGPGCVLALEDPKGLKLRVELWDAQGAESMAAFLWSHRE
ncbi:MAG: hypothetical protein ACREJ6_07150, partial [Candidatus Methylomirabilis sp.]